ncbi:MAG: hypothetical protein H7333_07655 [Bdellovibrionales bacterium]|nr:hypothetical protein [Oligoflexia bacterium]
MIITMIVIVGRRGDHSIEKAIPPASQTNFSLVTQQSKELPATPFLVDWCEGEDCEEHISRAVVCDSNLHSKADSSSQVVGKILNGQIVKDRTLFTKIVKLGSYRIDANHRGMIVSNIASGVWMIFKDGRWDQVEWKTDAEKTAAQIELPQTEAWALTETPEGITGFTQRFSGSDHQHCPFALQ